MLSDERAEWGIGSALILLLILFTLGSIASTLDRIAAGCV